MYKWLIAVVVLIVAIAIVCGFWYTQTQGTEATTIKIGVIGPFTGALAGSYGEAHHNGIVLAAEDFDAEGKHIEFVFEDSEYDTAKAISAFHKLVEVDGVGMVIDWGAATSFGIAPLAASAKMPFIAISVDPSTVKESEYVIRHNPSPDDYASKLWTHFRNNGYKRVALVNSKLLYFDLITAALEKQKNPDETVTVIDTYQAFVDHDFRTSILKIKAAKNYDTLGVFLMEGQISEFYKQGHALGLATPTFGVDPFESYTEIAAADGHMTGAVYVNIGASDEFVQKYKERFGRENQLSYAGLSYDLGNILINEVDYSNADSILASLRIIQNYNGTIGSYTYSNKDGDSYLQPTLFIKRIEGNTIEVIE